LNPLPRVTGYRSSIFLLAFAPPFEQAFLGIQPDLAVGGLGELGSNTRLDLSGKGFVPVQRGPPGFGNGAEPQALGERTGNIATVKTRSVARGGRVQGKLTFLDTLRFEEIIIEPDEGNVRADAFANAAGVVLDTFQFVDLHHTLELNPSEIARFQKNLADIVNAKAPLEPLLKSREIASKAKPLKVPVETRIGYDDMSSAQSTLLEIMAQDRPGLLYDLGSALARLGCNIDVALIDTEGQKAIDVFYLTERGKKLSQQKQELLREVLQSTLS